MAFARNDAAPFYAADLAVAQVIARRVAVALESAQLHERSLDQEGQRHRLEDALQKWIQVFDLAGWGAAIVDGADRRIEAVNPAFARLHGYSDADSLTGRLFSELLPLDHASELDDWFTSVANQSGPYESLHLRADGSTFPALTTVTALELGPKTTSYVVTMQDLTELKRAEERTRWAQRMEAVGRLAGGVAHEVNNMMTIIIGFGDLLSKAGNLPPDRQRDVEEIRKAALRAAKITQQLLAFSRQQVLQPTDLELNDVVSDIAPVLRLLLPANIRVETSLAPVPAAVHADRAQLDQVLINLAFNARDAMPAGGTIRLATGARVLDAGDGPRLIGVPMPPGDYALLTVSDTGHGMDPATLAHAFEPFFTTKPAGSGTGLGLATVYGIVKQSGGFVWVESRPGAGTTFTVSLPRLDRPIPTAAMAPAEPPAGSRVGGTVLVVEDEEGVLELTRRVLEQEGCRVFDARSG
jgi:PAS domain S-box-containing protein